MRPTLTEAEVFKMVLVSLLLGVIFGILYDLFTAVRIFRRSKKNKKWTAVIEIVLCFFEDILFFVLVSAGNVVLFSAYGGGKVRLEGIFAQLISFILWHMSVGKISAILFSRLEKAVKRMLVMAYNKTLKPLMGALCARLDRLREKKEQKYVKKYSMSAKAEIKRRLRGNTTRDQR